MEINPNRNLNPLNPASGQTKPRGGARVDGSASFEQSASLDSALAATPDSRADVIARAEKLVSSPSYPPPEVIQRIANLLASNLIAHE